MLDLNPDTVRGIVAKAHEFHAKEAVVIPEQPLSPADDWALQILADHVDDPCYQELRLIIGDLEPDQQMSLLALMWLGRGDYEPDDWGLALTEARRVWNRHLADYLITQPLVADFLDEGLVLLGYSCED